jgi:hypothetical protein
VAELGLLAADAGQEKLRLSLGEPHIWPLGPKRGASRPFWVPPLVVNCLKPPCFVGVSNVGCRCSKRQPRN